MQRIIQQAKMSKGETWSIIAAAAAAMTIGIILYAKIKETPERPEPIQLTTILWIFVGCVCVIAAGWGLIEVLQNGGIGDGEIS